MQRIGLVFGRILFWSLLVGYLLENDGGAVELATTLRLHSPVMLCGETVPIDDPDVVQRFEKEMLLSAGNPAQLILWLKRSTRYFPFIEKMLSQNNLPDDLKYLAVAESALRVHAGSTKGAMGVWQLMPQTAITYGLQVDDRIDERRNVYLSTPAALAYLIDLYDQFGSWALALAAYNMGAEGLKTEILEQDTRDYYRLYLPLETQRFILRLVVIKIIFKAPDAYGINLAPEDHYTPQNFTSVPVSDVTDLPLRLIATAAQTDFKTIKDLNPELRGYYLTTSKRMVNIPEHGDAGFHQRLAALIRTDATLKTKRLYVVQPGDSLSAIAKKFDVPIMALLIWNRIGIQHVIHPGQRLVVYPQADNSQVDPDNRKGERDG